MADFAVRVVEITDPVEHHPDADRLSLMTIGGYTCISNKLEDGSHRYSQGDLVVYVPEGAVVPEYLLKPGFWNEEKGKGILVGSQGNRVKALKLRGIFSVGILFPTVRVSYDANTMSGIHRVSNLCVVNEDGDNMVVEAGDDVAEFLGITKYEPPVPLELAGEVCNIHGKTTKYDFESIQTVPDLFTVGEDVVVTEKLHGCLHGKSLVMLPNGEERPIAEIIDDLSITKILSYDEKTGEFISRSITGRSRRPNLEHKKWVMLVLENGRSLTLTSDHPVYSRDRKQWIEAGQIQDNEDIESPVL
jgi:hypothetical protein